MESLNIYLIQRVTCQTGTIPFSSDKKFDEGIFHEIGEKLCNSKILQAWAAKLIEADSISHNERLSFLGYESRPEGTS